MARIYSITRRKRDLPRGNKRAQPPLTRISTEALWQPTGVATLYSLAGYLGSSVRESLRSNRPIQYSPPPINPLATPQPSDTDPRDIRDIFVSLTGLPSLPLPSARVRPLALRVRRAGPSRLGRISPGGYLLDVAHRFESVFESWNRDARSGEARVCLRQNSGNRTKSNYLRDSCRWYIWDISWRI